MYALFVKRLNFISFSLVFFIRAELVAENYNLFWFYVSKQHKCHFTARDSSFIEELKTADAFFWK